MSDLGESIIGLLRARYSDLFKRANAVLEQLSDADLHWRPNPESNSIANLVIHLRGNLRQRFHTDSGGAPDVRDRDAEFNDRRPYSQQELLAIFAEAQSYVEAGFDRLTPVRLAAVTTVRGQDKTMLEVVLSTATHLAEHTGQMLYIAKARLGADYKVVSTPHKKA